MHRLHRRLATAYSGADFIFLWELMARPVVMDGRNALDGTLLAGLGFTYEGVGRKP